MNLYEFSPAFGFNPKACRKGCGHDSGGGKTVGHGQKGQWTRSGDSVRVGFGGGQMSPTRHVPKHGFHNILVRPPEVINAFAFEKFEDGAAVNVCDLLEKGILSKYEYGYKVLDNGILTKELTARASAFSASVKEKIVAAGGKCEVV